MSRVRTYIVPVKFVFEGTFEIKASSAAEARELIENDCGLVLGGDIHTTLDDDDVDWEFDVHPSKSIGRITRG